MSYLPQPTQGDFTPPPAGTFPAICYRVIDLGQQKSEYNGETKVQHKVLLSWEIADEDERMADGRPFTVSSRYTWSMHEKAALRKDLEAWRGKAFEPSDFGQTGFDIRRLIGTPCMLSLVETKKGDRTYTNISGISKMPKAMACAPLVNQTVYLWLERDLFDHQAFATLSDNLRATIMGSPTYVEMMRGSGAPNGGHATERHDFDEDVPF